MEATRIFISHPWLAAVLWGTLHLLDYIFSILAARSAQGVADRVDFESYELNPVFRKPVQQLRWLSRRFLISLLLVTSVAWTWFALLGDLVGLESGVVPNTWLFPAGALLGMIVFTRVISVGNHVSNLAMFHAMKADPDGVKGAISFSTRQSLLGVARRYLLFGLVLAIGAMLTAHPWLIGGWLGCCLLSLIRRIQATHRKPMS